MERGEEQEGACACDQRIAARSLVSAFISGLRLRCHPRPLGKQALSFALPTSPRDHRAAGELLGAEVELEVGGGELELTERSRLELAHALAGDAELGADLLERLGRLTQKTEAQLEHVPHALGELVESALQLDAAEQVGKHD